jgi:hypothetical protein
MPPIAFLRIAATKLWTGDSSILLGGFFVTIFLIVYIWWPLAEEYLAYVDWDGAWWRYIDWLLLGIFGFMSLTIIARADIKTDLLIIFVGLCGDWRSNRGARRPTCGSTTRTSARRSGSSPPGRSLLYRLTGSLEDSIFLPQRS